MQLLLLNGCVQLLPPQVSRLLPVVPFLFILPPTSGCAQLLQLLSVVAPFRPQSFLPLFISGSTQPLQLLCAITLTQLQFSPLLALTGCVRLRLLLFLDECARLLLLQLRVLLSQLSAVSLILMRFLRLLLLI